MSNEELLVLCDEKVGHRWSPGGPYLDAPADSDVPTDASADVPTDSNAPTDA